MKNKMSALQKFVMIQAATQALMAVNKTPPDFFEDEILDDAEKDALQENFEATHPTDMKKGD